MDLIFNPEFRGRNSVEPEAICQYGQLSISGHGGWALLSFRDLVIGASRGRCCGTKKKGSMQRLAFVRVLM